RHRAQQRRRRAPRPRPGRALVRGRRRQVRLRRAAREGARPGHGRGRLHGRRPARHPGDARGGPVRGSGQCACLDARAGALAYRRARRRRRRARTVRPAAVRAGPPGRPARRSGRAMSWRSALTLVLLVAAIATGWSVWRQRAVEAPAAAGPARSDYVLHDFELVALDSQGKEAFVLRAPALARSPDDRTLSIVTPLFLIPDDAGQRWELRSKTGWVAADNSE